MSGAEVTCPKCGRAEDAAKERCGACGLVFLEWFERRAWGPGSRHASFDKAPKPRPRARKRGLSSGWLLAGALACGAGAAACLRGLWIVGGPRAGSPLPPQAFVDQADGFAFAPPSGWEFGLVDRAEGGYRQVVRLSRGAATIDVVVGPGSLAEELGKERAYALIQNSFNGAELQVQSAEQTSLDGLPAERIEASAARAYLPSPNAGKAPTPLHAPAPKFESVEARAVLVVASLGGRSYLIKIFSEKEQFQADRAAIEAFLSSFRVFRRPWLP